MDAAEIKRLVMQLEKDIELHQSLYEGSVKDMQEHIAGYCGVYKIRELSEKISLITVTVSQMKNLYELCCFCNGLYSLSEIPRPLMQCNYFMYRNGICPDGYKLLQASIISYLEKCFPDEMELFRQDGIQSFIAYPF